VLWARTGKISCPDCEVPVTRETPQTVWKTIRKECEGGTALLMCYPLVFDGGGGAVGWWEPLQAQGFQRVVRGDEVLRLDDPALPEMPLPVADEVIDVVVDRLKLGPKCVRGSSRRWNWPSGNRGAWVTMVRNARRLAREFSSDLRCNGCGRVFPEPTPRLFSFNSPEGACPACNGFGNRLEFDEDKIIPDPELTCATARQALEHRELLAPVHRPAALLRPPEDSPGRALRQADPQAAAAGPGGGDKGYTGRHPLPGEYAQAEMKKGHHRFFTRRFMGDTLCRACGGSRLRPEALAVKVQGLDLGQVGRMLRWRTP
jgi:excinuclease ABC subunit A